MKNLIAFAFILYLTNSALAQKCVPSIKVGTQMDYTISLGGQTIGFELTINCMGDSVKMKWEVADYGSGNYLMSAKSLQSGTEMYLQSPQPDSVIKISDKETMAFISKDAFKQMNDLHKMEFGNIKYVCNNQERSVIKVADRELDVLHAISTNGKTELWILNNPDFPLICKTKNANYGVDLLLDYIK